VLAVPFAWTNPSVGNLHPSETDWIGTIETPDIGIYVESLLLLIFGGIPWQVIF